MFLAFDGPTPMLTSVTPCAIARGRGDRPASGSGARATAASASLGLGRVRHRARSIDAARQHQRLEAAAALAARQAPAHELVDIAVVVGEQDPGLHVAPVAAGVVHAAGAASNRRAPHRTAPAAAARPPCTSTVRPRSRRRPQTARAWGNVGPARRRDAAACEFVAAIEHVGVGDLLVADVDLDRRRRIPRSSGSQLLEQVAAEGAGCVTVVA